MTIEKGTTRREFLKSTALATVATLSPLSSGSLLQTSSSHSPAELEQRLLTSWEYHQGELGGLWEVWGGEKGSDNVAWSMVGMPHCFNARDSVDPDQSYYQGPGWYRITLQPANPFANGRTLLHFEGAGQASEVFVGAAKVGGHLGGYDEFVVDITDAAAKALAVPAANGKIPVAVRCDNSRHLERAPSPLSDFSIYGGLYRYVNLVYTPALSLEGLHIAASAPVGKPASVSVKARVSNSASLSEDVRISIQIFDPHDATVYKASQTTALWKGERELASHEVKAPELWSPESPALYRCEVTLTGSGGEMKVADRFGFRNFEFVTHGPFLLNGKRLLLRGTQRHEDHAGLGSAMPEDLVRKEMILIKEAGVNFIRLGHYQQSRIVLDLCDELGLLVWEEIPWCRGGVGDEAFQQQVRNALRNMIDQHYNHPSVILWGLGNENDWPGEFPDSNHEKIRGFFQELHDESHRLDPSRKTAIRRCDFAKDILDVYSPSLWAGWYQGAYTDYKARSQQEMEKVNHFLHIEWGGDSHAGRHSELSDSPFLKEIGGDKNGYDFLVKDAQPNASKQGAWSESYACHLFDWHLKEQETMPWLTGSAQWIFKDFSTPDRPRNPIPRVNQKGLVERDLTPKEAYYVFQSYWTDKPMVHLYGHSWPIRWGEADEMKLVKVYSNGESAELFLNGASCGVKRRDAQDFPAAGLRWMTRFVPGKNHLRVVAHKGGATLSDEITFEYQIEKWEAPASFDLKEVSRQEDVVTVEARLLDAKGVLCLDAQNQIRFGLTGDGRLLDNLGTRAGSRVVELGNGRAEISLLLAAGSPSRRRASAASRDSATGDVVVTREPLSGREALVGGPTAPIKRVSTVSVMSQGLPTAFLTIA